MIKHNSPSFEVDDLARMETLVNTKYIGYGPEGEKLEEELCSYLGCKKFSSVVCSNGSSALYLALKALNIQPGGEVIVPAYTCTAIINAIFLANLQPKIVDISRESLCLDSLSSIDVTRDSKAIIAVHTYGNICDVENLKKSGIPVIEDCCQALGAIFEDGSKVGSKGDISVFSFYATKVITGGYGGAVLTENKDYYNVVKDYINFDMPDKFIPRFNFQLSDINSLIIRSQLKKLPMFLERRREIAGFYKDQLKNYFKFREGTNNYKFLLEFDSFDDLNECKKKLAESDIASIIPLTERELLNRYLGLGDHFENSLWASRSLLSLPIYPSLERCDVKKILEVLK